MRKHLKDLLVNEYDNIRFDIPNTHLSIWTELNFDYEMGEKVGECYCVEYFYDDEYLAGFDDGFEITPNDTIKSIQRKANKYLQNKYICLKDRQGGSFKVGDIMTATAWKRWALWDRADCCDDEMFRAIKTTRLKDIIEFIDSLWGITIVKATA